MPLDLSFPYYGARASWFVYHPAKHGPSYTEGLWEKCLPRFHKMLNDFVSVCELYTDQQTMHETVGGPKWKKEVTSLLNAIEKDGKDVYVLEALAEIIFDVSKKTEQRMLPYHEEVKKEAGYIRAEDINLSTEPGKHIDPSQIVQRGWGS